MAGHTLNAGRLTLTASRLPSATERHDYGAVKPLVPESLHVACSRHRFSSHPAQRRGGMCVRRGYTLANQRGKCQVIACLSFLDLDHAPDARAAREGTCAPVVSLITAGLQSVSRSTQRGIGENHKTHMRPGRSTYAPHPLTHMQKLAWRSACAARQGWRGARLHARERSEPGARGTPWTPPEALAS